jgi:hypothetical protein
MRVLLLCLVCAAPAFAHHSAAMFDQSKITSIKGVVKQFDWVNPHCVIWVNADIGGKTQLWAVELTSPGNLTRSGWTKRSVKPGDKVVIDVNPLHDGNPGGLFKKVTLTDIGKVLTYNLAETNPDTK